MTPLSPADRAALLGIARASILARLGLVRDPPVPERGALAEERGAFVTVRVDGELRGCIGTFQPKGSLARTGAAMAVAAASEDPRFTPIGPGEVGRLAVSVSALGTPHPLAGREALTIGRDGLLVKKGWHRGALLPHVAVEEGWGADAFLKHVCLKAGLHARAWEEPDTEVLAFEAEEFGEEPTP